MTIQQAIKVYEPIAAPLRHHGWKTWCKQFEQRWGSRDIASINLGDVNTLVAEMRKEGKSEATIYSKLSTLKRLFAAARSVGIKVYYPEETAKLRVNNSKVVSLSESEAATLRSKLHNDDWEICDLARETGMRGIELWSLQRRDVDLNAGFITVREDNNPDNRRLTKNGKVRRVPITKRARAILKKMLDKQRSVYVVVPRGYEGYRNRESCMENWKRDVLRPALRAASIEDFSFHGFRHDCATRLARAGFSLYQIQRFLGHSKSEMTQRYAHLVDDDLKKMAASGF